MAAQRFVVGRANRADGAGNGLVRAHASVRTRNHFAPQAFCAEIAVFNVLTPGSAPLVHGADHGFERRAYLLFDGVHYDALRLRDGALVLAHDDERREALESAAATLCTQLHAAAAFVDTAQCAIQCMVCGTGLQGTPDAQEHAQTTGHTNFRQNAR